MIMEVYEPKPKDKKKANNDKKLIEWIETVKENKKTK